MSAFHYHTVAFDTHADEGERQKMLDEHGENGWELVEVLVLRPELPRRATYFFKRKGKRSDWVENT